MQFTIVLTLLAAVACAAPGTEKIEKRAPVFTAKTYAELSISAGTAGKAEAEAKAKLGLASLPTDLKTVDKADIKFLKAVNTLCNGAEVAGFNTGIVAAGVGNKTLELQRGKIKNKVMKLMATVSALEAEQAQGKNVTLKLEDEKKKLSKNIAQDVAEAGKPSLAVEFTGTTADPDATRVPDDDKVAEEAGKIVTESGGKF